MVMGVGAGADGLGRWIPLGLRRPSGIVEGMRWLYLLAALLALLISLPAPLSVANPVTAALALGAATVLACSWIVGYRRRRSSVWLDVTDATALTAFVLASPEPAAAFTFTFSALWYRSLYASVPRTILTCATYGIGIGVAFPLWHLVPNGFPLPSAAPIVGTLPAMFLVSVVGRMLGASLFVREEGARRDAALAATGAALLAARDHAEIVAHADQAAADICAATPGLRSIAVFDNRVFANGAFADWPTALPGGVVEMAPDGRSGTVRDPGFLNSLTGAACAWEVVPAPHGGSEGFVLMGAPKRVPIEAVLAMTSLLNQVTFAIRNHHDRQCLTMQARTDMLTGLANRVAFTEALEKVTEPVAVLFIDLDDFKAVNDRLGHAAGDDLLREVASRLTASGGQAARLGGDEFALMITGLSDSEIDTLAQQVVEAIRSPIPVAGSTAFVGASVGIATSTGGRLDADLLLRQADQAMYAAKLAGKNKVRRHAPPLLTA